MFGLFAVALLMFIAPVSFASDGPETTRDCVIDVDVAMEAVSNVGELNVASDEAFVITSGVGASNGTMNAELFATRSNLTSYAGKYLYPDRKRQIEHSLTAITLTKSYNFSENDNRTRYLTKA